MSAEGWPPGPPLRLTLDVREDTDVKTMAEEGVRLAKLLQVQVRMLWRGVYLTVTPETDVAKAVAVWEEGVKEQVEEAQRARRHAAWLSGRPLD